MAITNGLITLADAKTSLGIPSAQTTYDTDIERYIEAATPVIENFTGALYVRNKAFTFDGGETSILLPERFSAIVSVVESGTTITDYVANGTSGIVYAGTSAGGRSFTYGRQNIVITASLGAATIPSGAYMATRELVRYWWQVGKNANRPGVAESGDYSTDVPSGLLKRVAQMCAPTPQLGGFA